jgi:hypothetical protein
MIETLKEMTQEAVQRCADPALLDLVYKLLIVNE